MLTNFSYVLICSPPSNFSNGSCNSLNVLLHTSILAFSNVNKCSLCSSLDLSIVFSHLFKCSSMLSKSLGR